MRKIVRAILMVPALIAGGCAAVSPQAQVQPSQANHLAQAAPTQPTPTTRSTGPWDPKIDKAWMVGNSEAMQNRPPADPAEVKILLHHLLAGAVRASGAPAVTVPRHLMTMDPVGPPTLYLKTPSGVYAIFPDYRIAKAASSQRVTVTFFRHGHQISQITKTPSSYHLTLYSPYVVIQREGNQHQKWAVRDPALFQWLAKNQWMGQFK